MLVESMLISDGMDQNGQSKIVQFSSLKARTVTCEPAYGFLPCTTEIWGQLFLIIVYQLLLSLSEKYISSGSNLFFEMFGTGVFGASMFQILGIFPLLLLILVSGISASEDAIGSAAAMSMGVLAGTTILNLTVVWGSVVAFGSYHTAESSWETNFSMTGYGVKTDQETKYTARIMLLSMIPFLLLQLAKIFDSDSQTRVVVLLTLIVTSVFLITYCTYQVFRPWMQNRRLEYLMRKHLRKKLLPVLCGADGKPSVAKISELFDSLDQNSDSLVSSDELRSLIIGIHIEDVGLDVDNAVSKVMLDFDISGDSYLNKSEFVQGLLSWLSKVGPGVNSQAQNSQAQNRKTLCCSDSEGISVQQQSKVTKTALRYYTKATFLVFLGTAITVLVAQSLLQNIQAFSTAVKIPSFLVSYFLIPLALSFRQAYRAILAARERTEKTVSLTLSEIYGGAFMNNVMGLTIFLGLVYVRDVSWDVSAEVLVVLVICSAMGLSASFTSRFPFWASIVAFALYPISLALIFLLTNFWGWG